MNKKNTNIEFLYSVFLIIFSFSFNYYYGNLGVFPIDTFAFFDTAYNILLGRHLFKDIWVTTGPVVDYLQALFFVIFGTSWKSYVIHSSFLNSIICFFFFKILIKFDLSKHLSFVYAIGLSILCYTISGTPFAYIHSYVLSLICLLIFFTSINFKSKFSFFVLPIVMFLAFLSMQNPSTFINIIVLFLLLIFFLHKKDYQYLFLFIYGLVSACVLFLIFFVITKVPLQNFFEQYFLFPLSMGENRVVGNEMAHITLSGRFTFRNVIGHFKFINILLILLTILILRDLYKEKISLEEKLTFFALIITGILLIFNQLITSNQTYIFSYIPFLAGFIHVYLYKKNSKNKILKIFTFCLMVFCVGKYHFVYNEQRKFMDLQNVNLNKTIDAKILSPKLAGLKWITPDYPDNVSDELTKLIEAKNIIKNSSTNIMIISDYQFFSLITEKNLFIPNRWYTHDNNSYPLDNHKYFEFYKKHINSIVDKNSINIIYTIGQPKFDDFKIYFLDKCFVKSKINEITYKHEIKKCN